VVARGVVLLEEWQRARGTAASRSGLLVVDFIFCWIEHLLGFVKFNVDVSFFFGDRGMVGIEVSLDD
jgi:hypothetical protein